MNLTIQPPLIKRLRHVICSKNNEHPLYKSSKLTIKIQYNLPSVKSHLLLIRNHLTLGISFSLVVMYASLKKTSKLRFFGTPVSAFGTKQIGFGVIMARRDGISRYRFISSADYIVMVLMFLNESILSHNKQPR